MRECLKYSKSWIRGMDSEIGVRGFTTKRIGLERVEDDSFKKLLGHRRIFYKFHMHIASSQCD